MAAKEEHSSKRRRRIYVSASASLGSSSSDLLIPGLIDDIALNCLALVSRLDYPSLSCVNKKYNKLINGGNLLGLRKKLGIVEYLVFMVRHCHVGRWVLFSPMKNKLLVLPEPPNNEFFNVKFLVYLAVDDEVFVFLNFSEVIWKFSLRSWCWVQFEYMDYPRSHFASGSLGGIAIVAGGIDCSMKILAIAHLYDSSTGRWEILPNMHTPRSGSSGFFMDGKFYVIGGKSENRVPITCGEELDLETRKWRKIEGMYPYVNSTEEAPPNFAVVHDELYTLEYVSYVVKKYDKANNKWEVMGKLPLDSINFKGIEIKACGDKLLVFCKEASVGGGGNGRKGFVVCSWCPKTGVKDGNLDLKVVGFKDNFAIYKTTTMISC